MSCRRNDSRLYYRSTCAEKYGAYDWSAGTVRAVLSDGTVWQYGGCGDYCQRESSNHGIVQKLQTNLEPYGKANEQDKKEVPKE